MHEEVVVLWRVAIAIGVAVPGRKVNAELQPVLVAGGLYFLHHIAFAAAPLRRGNRVPCCCRGPKAEPVVVFGCKDSHFETSLLQCFCPLPGIEVLGVEKRRVFLSRAPFAACKSIYSEMQEGCHFQFLPCQLTWRGHEPRGHVNFLFRRGTGRKHNLFFIIFSAAPPECEQCRAHYEQRGRMNLVCHGIVFMVLPV